MPNEQLILNEGKCNAALLIYAADDQVILQKNIKDMPQWASVGGKVDVEDQITVTSIATLTGKQQQVVALLRKQFKADKDPTLSIFAYTALREAIEEVGDNNPDFFYDNLLSGAATLVRVDRDNFGIAEANLKFWTEQFYLEFRNLPGAELVQKLKASGKADCQEIRAVPVASMQTAEDPAKPGMFITTFDGIMVRHTVNVVAKRLFALRARIAQTQDMDTNALLRGSFADDDPLRKADLGAGFMRVFIPSDLSNDQQNWLVVLGKRFNGKLKLSVGGAVDPADNSFFTAASRELGEEQFDQLPLSTTSDCIGHHVCFEPKSGKSGTDGMLYFTFMAMETAFTTENITQAVTQMNKVGPVYFALNKFFTTLSGLPAENINSEEIRQQATDFLAAEQQLPGEFQFDLGLAEELERLSKGTSLINGAEFAKFSEKCVHVYAEYSYFVAVPYPTFVAALTERKAITCTTPEGTSESVALFGAESDALNAFLPKIDAARAKMATTSTTPQFAASASVANTEPAAETESARARLGA